MGVGERVGVGVKVGVGVGEGVSVYGIAVGVEGISVASGDAVDEAFSAGTRGVIDGLVRHPETIKMSKNNNWK